MADTPMSDADAREIFTQTLKNYGFTDAQINQMLPQVLQWQTTYSATQIVNDLLPTTEPFKQRFAGNEARVKAGLKPLSASEYLAEEASYRSILRDSGMPSGFYDSVDDFTKFIANDVSPLEMKTRVDAASTAVNNADPAYREALRELYGVDEGTMTAYFLDADRALPLIQKQAKALEFGAAAARQGLKVTNIGEQFAGGATSTGFSAEQGYAQIASMLPETQKLGQIYNQNYDQSTAEAEVFGVGEGLASARRKRQKLGELEKSTFSGQSGISAGSLQSSKTGSF